MKFICRYCGDEFKQLKELCQHYELIHNQPQQADVIDICPMCGQPITEIEPDSINI